MIHAFILILARKYCFSFKCVIQCSPRNSNPLIYHEFPSNSNVSEFHFIATIQTGYGYFKMPLNSNLLQGFLTLNYVDCTVYCGLYDYGM